MTKIILNHFLQKIAIKKMELKIFIVFILMIIMAIKQIMMQRKQ